MPRPRSSTFYLPLAPADAPISLKAKLSVLPPQAANALLTPRGEVPMDGAQECARLERVLGLTSSNASNANPLYRQSTTTPTSASNNPSTSGNGTSSCTSTVLPTRSVRIRRKTTSSDGSYFSMTRDPVPPCPPRLAINQTSERSSSGEVEMSAAPTISEPGPVLEQQQQQQQQHPSLSLLPPIPNFLPGSMNASSMSTSSSKDSALSPISPVSPPTPAPLNGSSNRNGFFSSTLPRTPSPRLPVPIPASAPALPKERKPLGLGRIVACKPKVSSSLCPSAQVPSTFPSTSTDSSSSASTSSADNRSHFPIQFRLPRPPPPPSPTPSSSSSSSNNSTPRPTRSSPPLPQQSLDPCGPDADSPAAMNVSASAVQRPRYRISSSCELSRKVLKRSLGANPFARLEAVRREREREMVFAGFDSDSSLFSSSDGGFGGFSGFGSTGGFGMLGKFDWESGWPDYHNEPAEENGGGGSMFWDEDEQGEGMAMEQDEEEEEEESVFRFTAPMDVDSTPSAVVEEEDAVMHDQHDSDEPAMGRGRSAPPRPLLLDFQLSSSSSPSSSSPRVTMESPETFIIPPSPLASQFSSTSSSATAVYEQSQNQNTTPTASSFSLPQLQAPTPTRPDQGSDMGIFTSAASGAPWPFNTLRTAVSHLVEYARSRSPSPIPWLRSPSPSPATAFSFSAFASAVPTDEREGASTPTPTSPTQIGVQTVQAQTQIQVQTGSGTPKRNLSTSSFGSESESGSSHGGEHEHDGRSRSPSPGFSPQHPHDHHEWDSSYSLTPRSRPLTAEGCATHQTQQTRETQQMLGLPISPLLSPRSMPGMWDPREWDEEVVMQC